MAGSRSCTTPRDVGGCSPIGRTDDMNPTQVDRERSVQNSLMRAAIAAGAVSFPASAGVQTGAYASFSNSALGLFAEDADFGTSPSMYSAAVTGASADLAWGTGSSAFDGFANGGGGALARADGVAMFTFGSATTVSVTWSMEACVGEGTLVGWALVDLQTQEPVLGVSFEGLDVAGFGGVAAAAAGSFAGTVAAGTYLMVMSALAAAPGGAFSYQATFSAIPAPGVGALLIVSMAIAVRRRRR